MVESWRCGATMTSPARLCAYEFSAFSSDLWKSFNLVVHAAHTGMKNLKIVFKKISHFEERSSTKQNTKIKLTTSVLIKMCACGRNVLVLNKCILMVMYVICVVAGGAVRLVSYIKLDEEERWKNHGKCHI